MKNTTLEKRMTHTYLQYLYQLKGLMVDVREIINHGLEVVAVCYKGHCQMPERIKRRDCYSKGPPTVDSQVFQNAILCIFWRQFTPLQNKTLI